jgi:hypothetical protein
MIREYLNTRIQYTAERLRFMATAISNISTGRDFVNVIELLELQVQALKIMQYEFEAQIIRGMAHEVSVREVVEASQGGTIRIDGPDLVLVV